MIHHVASCGCVRPQYRDLPHWPSVLRHLSAPAVRWVGARQRGDRRASSLACPRAATSRLLVGARPVRAQPGPPGRGTRALAGGRIAPVRGLGVLGRGFPGLARRRFASRARPGLGLNRPRSGATGLGAPPSVPRSGERSWAAFPSRERWPERGVFSVLPPCSRCLRGWSRAPGFELRTAISERRSSSPAPSRITRSRFLASWLAHWSSVFSSLLPLLALLALREIALPDVASCGRARPQYRDPPQRVYQELVTPRSRQWAYRRRSSPYVGSSGLRERWRERPQNE